MKKILILISWAFLITTLTNSSWAIIKNSDKNLITVNGDAIKLGTFKQIFRQNQFYVGRKVVTKRQVIDKLINRQLGIQRAKKGQLINDSEVQRKIDDILYHAQISKDLAPKFKNIRVTDQNVKNYYKRNPEYRTAHILLRLPVEADKKTTSAAMKQIFKIYDDLKAHPEKFGQHASKYSQITTAPTGGDIGFQPAAKLAPEYFSAINGKGVGHTTPPVRTQFGYHIIKVLAVKDFKKINQKLYKKIIYDAKRDKIIDHYFAQLRQDATIKINENLIR